MANGASLFYRLPGFGKIMTGIVAPDEPKLMGVFARAGHIDALMIDEVDAHRTAGVDDFALAHGDAHMVDAAFLIVEEEYVAFLQQIHKVDRIAKLSLLPCIAWQVDARTCANHLHQARAVDAEYRLAAPEVGGVQQAACVAYDAIGVVSGHAPIEGVLLLFYLYKSFVISRQKRGAGYGKDLVGTVAQLTNGITAALLRVFEELVSNLGINAMMLLGIDPALIVIVQVSNEEPFFARFQHLVALPKEQLRDHLGLIGCLSPSRDQRL